MRPVKNYYAFYRSELKKDMQKTKILEQLRVYCECGHSIPMTSAVDRLICNFCGRYVYRTKEIEKEYKQKEFERKMKKYLKTSEEKENDIKARGRYMGTHRDSKNRKKSRQ